MQRQRRYWLEQIAPDVQAHGCFDGEFEQAAFCAALGVLNADANHPRVHAFGRLSHEMHGLAVPGTRAGHPVSDYVYRFVPIDASSRFILRGSARSGWAPRAFEVGLIDSRQTYLGTISKHELRIDGDGSFEIVIDPRASAGQVNHIRSAADARQLVIRDILADVSVERPFGVEIARCGPPALGPATDAAILNAYEPALRKFIDDLLPVNKLLATPPNVFASPALHAQGGHLVTQAYSAGHINLQDEEGLLVRMTLGNAAYAVVPLTNVWGGVGNFLEHRTALGTGRAAANPDGSYSFLISHHDPGVSNWVGTGGLQRGVVIFRWVGLRQNAGGSAPELETSVIRLADLPSQVGTEVPRVDRAERHAQLLKHRVDYLTAFA